MSFGVECAEINLITGTRCCAEHWKETWIIDPFIVEKKLLKSLCRSVEQYWQEFVLNCWETILYQPWWNDSVYWKSRCGSARTELKMWCTIVVNRGFTTRVKDEQTVCTVCTVQNVWWKKSESGEVTGSTYSLRTAVSQYPSLFGDRSDNQNMYAQCVRLDEWAQGGMRSNRQYVLSTYCSVTQVRFLYHKHFRCSFNTHKYILRRSCHGELKPHTLGCYQWLLGNEIERIVWHRSTYWVRTAGHFDLLGWSDLIERIKQRWW